MPRTVKLTPQEANYLVVLERGDFHLAFHQEQKLLERGLAKLVGNRLVATEKGIASLAKHRGGNPRDRARAPASARRQTRRDPPRGRPLGEGPDRPITASQIVSVGEGMQLRNNLAHAERSIEQYLASQLGKSLSDRDWTILNDARKHLALFMDRMHMWTGRDRARKPSRDRSNPNDLTAALAYAKLRQEVRFAAGKIDRLLREAQDVIGGVSSEEVRREFPESRRRTDLAYDHIEKARRALAGMERKRSAG